ncbi:MAG: hypothetical protein ACYDBX_02530 [Patescibacteria group bacterium]
MVMPKYYQKLEVLIPTILGAMCLFVGIMLLTQINTPPYMNGVMITPNNALRFGLNFASLANWAQQVRFFGGIGFTVFGGMLMFVGGFSGGRNAQQPQMVTKADYRFR